MQETPALYFNYKFKKKNVFPILFKITSNNLRFCQLYLKNTVSELFLNYSSSYTICSIIVSIS